MEWSTAHGRELRDEAREGSMLGSGVGDWIGSLTTQSLGGRGKEWI